ncbi:MAG TPA: GNAT family N-acetyltransferase [Ktedonobacterales bacterium]|nr:GNAT family N-acetyltransferase [Ktedonobacterales bacterium]
MGSVDMMNGVTPPDGYSARAATLDDAEVVARLRSAYQADEGDASVTTAEEQLNDWAGENLAEDSLLVFAPDGSLAAHADIFNRRYLQVSIYGGVHPEHTHRGLGTLLTRWGEAWIRNRMERAPSDAQITVQHYINTRNEAAYALMEALGYSYGHTIYVMRIEMDEPPPAPERIEGLRLRTFVPGQDERATFDAVEEAFHDLRGRPEGDFDRWLEFTENERQDPELWYLAEDEASGEIVGTCLARNVPGSGTGWVGGVGVKRPWRRRGVALAMLRAAFGACYRRGIANVELSVDADSPSGAPGVYMRAGMHATQSISLYRRQLRPGKDYNTLPDTTTADA